MYNNTLFAKKKISLVSFFYWKMVEYLSFFFKKPITILEINIMDESEKYMEKQKTKFLSVCNSIISDENVLQKRNENIASMMYSFEKIEEKKEEELEKEWKSRILIENTPRGNVIMYYDTYKHAFAYAADQNIPYPILNACAMKYVLTFQCFDFFVDTTILPGTIVSPFSILLESTEQKEKEISQEKKKHLGISFPNAPFAKLKLYDNSSASSTSMKKTTNLNLISNPNLNTTTIMNISYFSLLFSVLQWLFRFLHLSNLSNIDNMVGKESKIEDVATIKKINMNKYSNNFRYLGKISNISLLLKPEKKPVRTNPKLNVPVESFDYLTYKNSLKKNEITL